MRISRRSATGSVLAAVAMRSAFAAAKPMTYLLPAPATLPAFLPFQLAQKRGYFAANGLAVTFEAGRGGADVAKQVGVGNADLGGGVGETSMIVRPNGLPIRGVAMLGQKPLFELVTRKAVNVRKIEDLRGKTLGVSSYQDTAYYALLAVLAARGIKRTELQIQQVGVGGVTQLMIAKSLDGIMAVPEWSESIEAAGVPLDFFPIDKIFPAMAQAIMASDKIIKEKPEVVGGCVKAVLRAVRDCMADPPSALGRFDPERLRTVQSFYFDNKIIQRAVPIDDLYTNQFVS